jgi:hypothetical protein
MTLPPNIDTFHLRFEINRALILWDDDDNQYQLRSEPKIQNLALYTSYIQ